MKPLQETAQSRREVEVARSVEAPTFLARRKATGYLSDAGVALSLSNIVLLPASFNVFHNASHGYFNKASVTAVTVVALLSALLGLAAVIWVIFALARSSRNASLRAMLELVAWSGMLVPLNFIRVNYWSLTGPNMTNLIGHPVVIGASGVLVLALLRWHRVAARASRVVLLALLPLALLTAGRTGVMLVAIGAAPASRPLTALAVPMSLTPQPHVVWILFDELDQRRAFSERPGFLRLPEFDRFAREAVFANEAFPPAGSTLLSIPALTTGRPVTAASPSGPSELSVMFADTGRAASWGDQPTLFSRARELRINTGLVGWYHPYDRVFASSLNYCVWYPYPLSELSRGETFSEILGNQLWSTALPLQRRRLHLELYRHALDHSIHLITNTSFGLIFLHLPVPHLPGVFDTKTQRFTITCFSREQYVQNLVLADRTFGLLRKALENSGNWDKTWLLVSSDHWWREAASYDGKLDHRVPFILKGPGPHPGAVFSEPFNTVVTHDLLLAILRKELSAPEQIIPWLKRHCGRF